MTDRFLRHFIGDTGRKSESLTAKRLGARKTAASGARPHSKGDMVRGEFRIEAKSTQAASATVKLDDLLKIQSEATQMNQTPALTLTFVTGDGRPRPGGKWVVIPEWLFNGLLEAKDE